MDYSHCKVTGMCICPDEKCCICGNVVALCACPHGFNDGAEEKWCITCQNPASKCFCAYGARHVPRLSLVPSVPPTVTMEAGETFKADAVHESLCAIAERAVEEAESAEIKWGAFNSAHEGFAVLLEEVDELKAHVWTNQKRRDIAAMRAEAIQVAAMAIRFVHDICNETAGRK